MTLDPEDIHRTALLHAHDGTAPSLVAAMARQGATTAVIIADEETCHDVLGQIAFLTALKTASRAFGTVYAETGSPEATMQRGPHSGQTLAALITAEGAGLGNAHTIPQLPPDCPVILIGSSTTLPSYLAHLGGKHDHPVIRAHWSGWAAMVTPKTEPQPSAAVTSCPLAAMAAAALAICEAFDSTRGRAGSDGGYRHVILDLWSPDSKLPTDAPPLLYAPHSWWLVGLGHLGQANAWVLAHLGYEGGGTEIILQDVDVATASTWSTGLLTPRGLEGPRKTRYVADELEKAGLATRILERRLLSDLRAHEAETHVALLGVDNLPTRRLISQVGWKLAIDVGLGAGASDFASLTLRRFPGDLPSHEIASWQDLPVAADVIPDRPAFTESGSGLDRCGIVEVAGKAVGASFVGIVAACVAVAESVRETHSGQGYDVLTHDLLTSRTMAARASRLADVISRPLQL